MVIENYLVINTTQWDAQVKNQKGSMTSLIHFLSFNWTFFRNSDLIFSWIWIYVCVVTLRVRMKLCSVYSSW